MCLRVEHFVVSDSVDGLDSLVDGAVPQYSDAASLKSTIDRLLADHEARAELAARGHKAVLDRHTFADRAAEFASVVGPLIETRARKLSR